MKQTFVTLAFLLSMMGSLPAQNSARALPADQPGSVTVVSDTTDAAYEARTDSIIQAKVEKQVNKEMKKWKQRYGKGNNYFPDIPAKTQAIGILAIILGFVFPVFIVGMVLYYRYKNKKERYEVMKLALAHGKSLPTEFGNETVTAPLPTGGNDLLWRKGVKTFFLGLGLALFLGILTESFALSSIGLLILCIGCGEIVLGWFPSASQVKGFCHRQGQSGKPWSEQPETPRSETAARPKAEPTEAALSPDKAPQAEPPQAAPEQPSTPPQEARETEETGRNGQAEETDRNDPAEETSRNNDAEEASSSNEADTLPRTDKEETKG